MQLAVPKRLVTVGKTSLNAAVYCDQAASAEIVANLVGGSIDRSLRSLRALVSPFDKALLLQVPAGSGVSIRELVAGLLPAAIERCKRPENMRIYDAEQKVPLEEATAEFERIMLGVPKAVGGAAASSGTLPPGTQLLLAWRREGVLDIMLLPASATAAAAAAGTSAEEVTSAEETVGMMLSPELCLALFDVYASGEPRPLLDDRSAAAGGSGSGSRPATGGPAALGGLAGLTLPLGGFRPRQ